MGVGSVSEPKGGWGMGLCPNLRGLGPLVAGPKGFRM
jgi:hypothetical protein